MGKHSLAAYVWRAELGVANPRPIYWRVLDGATYVAYSGVFRDLKTLSGATRRLRRKFPLWRETEASFEPTCLNHRSI